MAIVIGQKEQYTNGIFSAMMDPKSTLLMLEEPGPKPEVFRNVRYAWADKDVAQKGGIQGRSRSAVLPLNI